MIVTYCYSCDSFAGHWGAGGSDGDWDFRCGGGVVAELTKVVISPSIDGAITGEG